MTNPHEVLTKLTLLRHFKGGLFMFLNFATLESTGEEAVVYQSLKDGHIWVRAVSEMFDNIEYKDPKHNITGQTYRFEVVQNAFDI